MAVLLPKVGSSPIILDRSKIGDFLNPMKPFEYHRTADVKLSSFYEIKPLRPDDTLTQIFFKGSFFSFLFCIRVALIRVYTYILFFFIKRKKDGKPTNVLGFVQDQRMPASLSHIGS